MTAFARDKTTWATAAPPTDPVAIGQFARVVITPGNVHELRILRKDTGPTGKKLIDSAFVTDSQTCSDIAAGITGAYASGVYVTMNPVDPSLPAELGRSLNRLYRNVSRTTPDTRITRRRILLIDVDAANPPGMSATAEERAAALATRDEIEIWLQGEGWRSPRVVTCSGNGGGLLYEIDLPNDEASRQLIKRALEALHARFTTPAATVDVANSNAARITRSPGTVTAKGGHTPERPWRRATAGYPDGAGIVTRAQFEALAAQAPSAKRGTSRRRGAAADDDRTSRGDNNGDDEYARLLEEGAPAGQRRTVLLKLVGHYLHRRLSPREIGVILRPWADRCQPPVPHAHLDDIIRDVANAEARKQPRTDEEDAQGDTPLTERERVQRDALQRAYATIADLTAQITAWEILRTTKAFPTKAAAVLVHMHKRAGVRLGQPLPDDMPCNQYADDQDIAAEGIARSAYKEGLDILLNLGLVTQKQVMKKIPDPEPGAGDTAPVRGRGRGVPWFYMYGLAGPAVNALWIQLPTMIEIAPTKRQVKAAESRKDRLARAIEEEQPTLHVVRALKREVADVRQDRQNVVFEYRAVSQERDNARAQAEAAARERDRALQDAQRIIRDHQQPAVMLGCTGCGQRINLATYRCDDCRAREREEAGDLRLTSNLKSPTGAGTVEVTNRLTSNLKYPDPPMKPCTGECGTLTPHGWPCKPCRTLVHIPTPTVAALGQREVRHDR